MGESVTIFLVVYILIAVIIYTGILIFGYISARNTLKKQIDYMINLYGIIEDIRESLVSKEENKRMEFKPLTLSEVINTKPTEENYQEVIAELSQMANHVFSNYKFLIAKSDKNTEPHFMQLVSSATELPEAHKNVFEKSIRYNLDYEELTLRFATEVKNGNVVDLGDDVVVIIYDGTEGGIATGVSKFVSGLEDSQIQFNITFIHKDNYDAWYNQAFEDKDNE